MEMHLGTVMLKFGEDMAIFLGVGGVVSKDIQTDRETDRQSCRTTLDASSW